MKVVITDGGREAAGYGNLKGDCVVRAIAIATGKPYQEVREALTDLTRKHERHGRGSKGKGLSNVSNGVYRQTYERYLKSLGWKFTPTMAIGSGCKVHMREDELPKGTIIVFVSQHLVTVIDGVVHDLSDPCRDGTRCVYGYYSKGT